MLHIYVDGVRRQLDPPDPVPVTGGHRREWGPFAKGYIYGGHQHYVDHWLDVREGPLIVRTEDEAGRKEAYLIEAPNLFLIAKTLFHEIEVVGETGRWDCLFTGEQLAGAEDPAIADKQRR